MISRLTSGRTPSCTAYQRPYAVVHGDQLGLAGVPEPVGNRLESVRSAGADDMRDGKTVPAAQLVPIFDMA